jgi:hypothetical protein
MKSLFESIISKDRIYTELEKNNIKTDLFNAQSKWMGLVDKYIETFKKDSYDEFKKWLKEHPTRRNISAESSFSVGVVLYEESRLYDELCKEMHDVGVLQNEFDNPKNYFGDREENQLGETYYLYRYNLSAPTYKQFTEGKYKESEYFDKNITPHFEDSRVWNGYNNLSADDQTILRKKMYDCIKGFEAIVYKIDYKYSSDRHPILPQYRVVMKAIFDKKKLKDLLVEIRSDKRLQRYAQVMKDVRKGISDYYASKGPGDYTGD